MGRGNDKINQQDTMIRTNLLSLFLKKKPSLHPVAIYMDGKFFTYASVGAINIDAVINIKVII